MILDRYQVHHYLQTGQKAVFDYVLNRYLTKEEVDKLELEYQNHLKEIEKLTK